MQSTVIPRTPHGSLRRIASLEPRERHQPGIFRPADLTERIRRLRPLAQVEGVALDVQSCIDDDEARACDADRLLQLATSLVSVAIRFTRSGTVSVHVDSRSEQPVALRLSFADIGDADRDGALLWSRRGKPDAATIQSLVRDFVTELGAEVGLATGLDEHSHLIITLPRLFPAKPREDIGGLDLLLVGAESATLEATAPLLAARDARVTHLSGPDFSAPLRCDIVVIDIDVAGDERSVLFSLRQSEGAQGRAATPVIALTDSVTREDAERLFCMGFDALLFKPVGLDHLCATLRRLHDQHLDESLDCTSGRQRDAADWASARIIAIAAGLAEGSPSLSAPEQMQ